MTDYEMRRLTWLKSPATQFTNEEVNAMLSRAERAEARVKELEAVKERLQDAIDWTKAIYDSIEELVKDRESVLEIRSGLDALLIKLKRIQEVKHDS